MTYRIGLDIGIGSVGWAVVSAAEEGHSARIEDFGTRIFSSGEKAKNSESLCKDRRDFRGGRRLIRRRSYRKKMLINCFARIGLINNTFNDDLANCRDCDVYTLKTKGLDERLSSAELYKCLIHTCNHRGYKDFYEPEEDDKEAGKNESAANDFEKAFKESGKRTVSEYLLFAYSNNGLVKFRNRKESGTYILIRRALLEKEVDCILTSQARFYPCLTEQNRKLIQKLIFNQRDFEDGPGDPSDISRRYHGFIESLGSCPFYPEKNRGFRSTVIADVYAVTNTLSQYRFIKNGEYCLEPAVARKIIDNLLENGNLGFNELKSILKESGYQLFKSEKPDSKALGKSIRFLGIAKKAVNEAGFSWKELISEEQFDPETPSLLHKIGELLSKYQTPSRRIKEMKSAGIDSALIKAFSGKKMSGTAATSYQYMCEAINAFLSGEVYGNFQANFNKNRFESAPIKKTKKLSSAQIDDADLRNNHVVFKAINETRKIVNAIIDTYGSPETIVIEVASELGRSVEARNEIASDQKKHEKENDAVKKKIAELLSIDEKEVKGGMIERYKLYQEQGGKSAYTRDEFGDLKEVLVNEDKAYEVDHIVPYSLILDNTLDNKALVFATENQEKKQRTPLMYLDGEKKKAFCAFVKDLYSRKENPISKKKYNYYMMKTLYGSDAEKILSEWKSRNINDTRYITKYIAGLFRQNLQFAGNRAQHVFTVKGAVTQRFRQEWFPDSKWGAKEKDRNTCLNHAIDALVAANLTNAYIEIGSDALRLRAIYKWHRSTVTEEYNDYLDNCVRKMQKYYGFSEEYTRALLKDTGRVPSYVPRLAQEVSVRFNDTDEREFNEGIKVLYGNESPFTVSPHMPITSRKQEKKFRGCIADANLVKVVTINGQAHKIAKKNVSDLNEEDLPKLYTNDPRLKEDLTKILQGKSNKDKDNDYTIRDYLSENNLPCFMSNGIVVRRVSLDAGVFSNYYRKEIGDGNYSNLSMLKYYCVEVYEDHEGCTRLCGVRFVDLVHQGKKLYRKAESLPENYARHVMYLFRNDYITVYSRKKKGESQKYEGYFQSVANIYQSKICITAPNSADSFVASISQKDRFVKTYIDILGKRGGEIRCSEPLPCIGEKKSQ